MNRILFSAESLDRLILNRFNLCHLILNGLITQGAKPHEDNQREGEKIDSLTRGAMGQL
jgi:hypothetical protein